jgi:hypothetical protein
LSLWSYEVEGFGLLGFWLVLDETELDWFWEDRGVLD